MCYYVMVVDVLTIIVPPLALLIGAFFVINRIDKSKQDKYRFDWLNNMRETLSEFHSSLQNIIVAKQFIDSYNEEVLAFFNVMQEIKVEDDFKSVGKGEDTIIFLQSSINKLEGKRKYYEEQAFIELKNVTLQRQRITLLIDASDDGQKTLLQKIVDLESVAKLCVQKGTDLSVLESSLNESIKKCQEVVEDLKKDNNIK